jgi:hypothetical protein
VVANGAAIELESVLAAGELLEIPLEQLVNRRVRARTSALRHFALHAVEHGLSLLPGTGACRDRLDEREPLLRERVLAGVHPYPQ